MKQKIKSSSIKVLFKLFSLLANKTGGWKVFVIPKLFFGILIVSTTAVSVSSCNTKKEEPTCYAPPPLCYDIPADSTQIDTANVF